jgi:selenocysteine lyase/cysteine desulfurase
VVTTQTVLPCLPDVPLPSHLRLLTPDFVPVVGGGWRAYAHFDHAATTPPLAAVWDDVRRSASTYGSVHRGDGWPSIVMSQRHEGARATVASFVGAREDDAVVFTRNTTDALTLLAHALPVGTHVVHFGFEHHANLLPWRSGTAVCLPIPSEAGEIAGAVSRALAGLPAGPRLVTVTGATNVTGELIPLDEVADAARRGGARLAVDAAQLAGHRPVDMGSLGIDYLALSGHKMYAPFGAGALVGRRDWLDRADPYLPGGGAASHVDLSGQTWVDGPQRHEGGTPNAIGILALAKAAELLGHDRLHAVESHEERVGQALRQGLRRIAGVELLSMWPGRPGLGVVAFTVSGISPWLLSAALSAEHAIGVRVGAFCAQPLVAALAPGSGCSPTAPAAVRASVGLGTSLADVERLLAAVDGLLTDGPGWSYGQDTRGRWQPAPDPRVTMVNRIHSR